MRRALCLIVLVSCSGEDADDAVARVERVVESTASLGPSNAQLSFGRGTFRIEDARSQISVSVSLAGSEGLEPLTRGRFVSFGDHLVRALPDGAEDFLVVRAAESTRAVFHVALGATVAGLRQVGDVVEILDASGAPRLRATAPWVMDADGVKHPLSIHVEGCAIDADPRAPWGRAVVEPGARRCDVVVEWPKALRHPLVVDPAWTTTASMAKTRYGHFATLLPTGKVLVAGGVGNGSSAELYDEASGTWAMTGTLVQARWGTSGFVMKDGKVLLVAGDPDGGTQPPLSSCELYDPATGTFTRTGNLSVPRRSFAAALLGNGKVLIAGGYSGAAFPLVRNDGSELYDPAKGTWTISATTPKATHLPAAVTLPSGAAMVVGAGEPDRDVGYAFNFDPSTSTWSTARTTKATHVYHTLTLLEDGRVLIVGTRDPEVWDSATGFNATPPLLKRWGQTATLLSNGNVLLTGGTGEAGTLDLTAVYLASRGTWSIGAPLASKRTEHTATRLPSGKVLIAGGHRGDRVALSTTELFSALSLTTACTAGGECASGYCADGICCDTLCDGPCEACTRERRGAGEDGKCGPVAEGTDPRERCAPDLGFPKSCKADGMCDGAGACRAFAPKGTACEPDKVSCKDGIASGPLCDGAGTCSDQRFSCSPYICGASACLTSCKDDRECSLDARCDAKTKRCIKSDVCDGDHTLTKADGTTADCSPFRCSGELCKKTCGTSSDCVAGLLCEVETGNCVQRAEAPTDEGGCSMGSSASGRFPFAPWLLLGTLIAWRRRRSLLLAASLAASCTRPESEDDVLGRLEAAGLPAGAASIDRDSLRAGGKLAEVQLPERASEPFRLSDPRSGATIDVRLVGARPVPALVSGGRALYRDALGPALHLVHRPSPEGTEDWIAVDGPDAPASLAWDVSLVRGVVGLRKVVDDVVELIDERGAPRLRVHASRAIDAHGRPVPLELAVEGCAYDSDPREPFDRAPVRASRCVLRVRWPSDAARPLLVDPSWTTTGSLSFPRAGDGAVLLSNGKVLVAAGGSSNTEIFDPATGTFAMTGAASAARSASCTVTLASGKVLLAGGSSGTSFAVTTAELFDPATGTWTATGAMKAPHSYDSCARLTSGKVMILGYFETTSEVFVFGETYDPASGAWTRSANSALQVNQPKVAPLSSGRALVSGRVSFGTENSVIYDPATGAWTKTTMMQADRDFNALAPLTSGKVLAFGGHGFDGTSVVPALSTADLYDPATGKWTATGKMAVVRKEQPFAVLPSGAVFTAGGVGASNEVLSTAESYDPTKGTWAGGGAMSTPRRGHGLVALSDGRVLAVGGSDGVKLLSSAELFSALSGATSCTGATECASGFCVDGVCCDRACTGACEACSKEKKGGGDSGVCGFVADGTDPRDRCPADPPSSCRADGMCDGKGACRAFAPKGTVCDESKVTCKDAVVEGPLCDGAGVCASSRVECAPFGCNTDNTCRTSCRTSDDCATGNKCDLDRQQCVGGAKCQDAKTVVSASGAASDCTPYACADNACRESCLSSADCASGFSCDTASRRCAPGGGEEDSGGCALGPTRGSHGDALLIALAALTTLAARSRRRGPTRR